jgi:glycosyltransferase involved in cell wall biosynthesis
MRILHVTQGYYPALGGTERMVQRLSEELVQQFGDQVTVFTTNCYSGEGFINSTLPRMPAGLETLNGVNIQRFPVSTWVSKLARLPGLIAYSIGLPFNQYLRALASGPVVPGLARAIRAFPADVVMASSFPLLHMYSALSASRQAQHPCVLVGGLHPQDDWGFNRPMIYQAIRRADAYIAFTPFESQYVIDKGAQASRVTAVGLGVDYQLYEGISTEDARRRLNLPLHEPLVGYIGQLGQHKGVHILIQSMTEVWKSIPECNLLIAGARATYANQLEQQVANLPEEYRRKVIFKLNFEEQQKPWLFSALDIFTSPSGYESFGITFLEAWSAGKPVIGCWRGGVTDVVDSGCDGLLVHYQKVKELADAILLLLHNPTWAREIGKRGNQKVHERFAWPTIARCFREVYTHVAGENLI